MPHTGDRGQFKGAETVYRRTASGSGTTCENESFTWKTNPNIYAPSHFCKTLLAKQGPISYNLSQKLEDLGMGLLSTRVRTHGPSLALSSPASDVNQLMDHYDQLAGYVSREVPQNTLFCGPVAEDALGCESRRGRWVLRFDPSGDLAHEEDGQPSGAADRVGCVPYVFHLLGCSSLYFGGSNPGVNGHWLRHFNHWPSLSLFVWKGIRPVTWSASEAFEV